MLNIALLRDVDSGLINHTRRWLEDSASHVFHLVVDELHMYRGTAGTEVAYLIRNLLLRLGLSPDSSQVRFLAASASLGDENDAREYLSQFFGASRSSFSVLEGRKRQPTGAADSLTDHAASFAAAAIDDFSAEDAIDLLDSSRANDIVQQAISRRAPDGGSTIALSELDSALFPDEQSDHDGSGLSVSQPMVGLLRLIERATGGRDVHSAPPPDPSLLSKHCRHVGVLRPRMRQDRTALPPRWTVSAPSGASTTAQDTGASAAPVCFDCCTARAVEISS